MSESRFQYITYMKTYFFGLPFKAELKAGGKWSRFFPDGSLMTEGEFLEFTPPSKLVMSWLNVDPEKKAEGFSRCVMELSAIGSSTRLSVTHSSSVERSKLIDAVAGAWPQVLSNLKSFLETGDVALTTPVR